MILGQEALAKRYAIAFLNVFEKKYTREDIRSVFDVKKFFEKNRYIYITLQRPSIPLEIRKDVIHKVIKHFGAQDNLLDLATALFASRRIHIFTTILKHICDEYDKKNNIIFFRIYSSHPLSLGAQNVVKKLIDSMISARTITTFELKSQLIVGLRIEGREHLWERSIRKELSEFSTLIAQKGPA